VGARLRPLRDDEFDAYVEHGKAWFARQVADPLAGGLLPDRLVAFVASIEIAEPFRRRGFARQAMLLLEDEARAKGLDRIILNVYGNNEPARSLYQSLGYDERAVTMVKQL
jgi:ribosomal protein S18 acetylase RimI-like enzyme